MVSRMPSTPQSMEWLLARETTSKPMRTRSRAAGRLGDQRDVALSGVGMPRDARGVDDGGLEVTECRIGALKDAHDGREAGVVGEASE